MTSPLADLANARILWQANGGRSSGRDGFKRTGGDYYLIRAFLKRANTLAQYKDGLDLPAVGGQQQTFKGYCVSFAQITEQQAQDFAQLDVSALTFDTTATLPPGITRHVSAKLSFPGMGIVDVRFADKEGTYGEEGIGAILRGVIGDSIILDGGQVG